MTVATQLVDAFQPWMTADLAGYLTALGGMFSEYEEYAAVQPDGTPGWLTLFDPNVCPVAALPFLAQIVGERLPAGIGEADARQWIKDAPNQIRGTTSAICRAARRNLQAGSAQTVLYRQRTKLDGTSDPDYLQVATYAVETPNQAQTLQDILSVTPADIHVDYRALTGASWADVKLGFASWTALLAADPTWNDVKGSTAAVGWSVCGTAGVPLGVSPPVIS